MVALCVRPALNDPVLYEVAEATQHPLKVDPRGYSHIPRAARKDDIEQMMALFLWATLRILLEISPPFHRNIQVPDTAESVQEWIPLEWWYFPPGEDAARGPFLWDQMLGWKLQGWLDLDLLIMPSGFRSAYRLAELFPGEAAFLLQPAIPAREAAPAVLALQNGTVDRDVVAEFRAAVEGAAYDLRRILYVACEQGALRVAQWAFPAIGADANEEEQDLSTPAHAASGHGHPEVLPILAAHGANLDKPEMDGWTPAHVASSNGNEEVLQMLAALGADMNAVNELSNEANMRSVADVWQMPLP
jgi:hypothetical protein